MAPIVLMQKLRLVRRGTYCIRFLGVARQLPPMLPLVELPPYVLHVLNQSHKIPNLLQLPIAGIGDEIRTPDGILGLPGVRIRIIINNNHPPEIAKATQVLDMETLGQGTSVAIEARSDFPIPM